MAVIQNQFYVNSLSNQVLVGYIYIIFFQKGISKNAGLFKQLHLIKHAMHREGIAKIKPRKK